MMSRLNDLRTEWKRLGEEHRKTFRPTVDGTPVKVFHWWERETGKIRRPVNLCHFFWTVVLWAPWSKPGQVVLGLLAVAGFVTLCIVFNSVLQVTLIALTLFAAGGYVMAGSKFAWTLLDLVLDDEQGPKWFRVLKDDHVGAFMLVLVLSLPFVAFLALCVAVLAFFESDGFESAWYWYAKRPRFNTMFTLRGYTGFVLFAGLEILFMVWGIWRVPLITLAVVAIVAVFITIGAIKDRLEQKYQESQRAKRVQADKARSWVIATQLEPALQVLFEHLHPRKTGDRDAFLSWKQRYYNYVVDRYGVNEWEYVIDSGYLPAFHHLGGRNGEIDTRIRRIIADIRQANYTQIARPDRPSKAVASVKTAGSSIAAFAGLFWQMLTSLKMRPPAHTSAWRAGLFIFRYTSKSMKKPFTEEITLDKIVGGGQALGSIADGRKAFVWGGLPGEKVVVSFHKQKRNFVEGIVQEVVAASKERVEAKDPGSYLSTSPWQIMSFDAEQHYKAALVEEAFEMHDIVLPGEITVYSDEQIYGYRNKVEFSFWWDNERDELDLAFFQRGSHGKIPVEGTTLAREEINVVARKLRDILRAKPDLEARSLKTLMIRSDQKGNVVFQLYVKDKGLLPLLEEDFNSTGAQGGEVIYSDPKSPASVITKRVASYGDTVLVDTVLDVPFRYACEGFFQGNIPVYEAALSEMQKWVTPDMPVVDMYSGVGSIGFTIGGNQLTLVEINKAAIDEMKKNRYELGKKATIIETSSEAAVEYITGDSVIILDPPRAGLHGDVIDRLLEVKPARIIYLSCNPVTQARDVKYLAESYGIRHHAGFNFFPRTPHIEHLVVLDLK
jgi:23S rRNA (uracil1939-C5)-methyltransferase